MNTLDLFSGCGGLSFGFSAAGFKIVCGVDNWSDALSTFARNHPNSATIKADLSEPNSAEKIIATLNEPIDLIIGGPPCQGFSISGPRNPMDKRNYLYKGFLETTKLIRPRVIVLENVPNITSMSNGKIFESMIKDFSSLGYQVTWKKLLASEFGVPQRRNRLFMVGVLGNRPFEFKAVENSENPVTCREAINDLPERSLQEGSLNTSAPKSLYQEQMRNRTNSIFNHQSVKHTDKTKQIISMVPEGGNYKDLPEEFRNTRKVNIAWTRYHGDKPSLTIDTGHRHHFHYEYNRVPTVRESARLQSFPDDFVFMGSKTSQFKQVGNAVPPLLSEKIGLMIKETI